MTCGMRRRRVVFLIAVLAGVMSLNGCLAVNTGGRAPAGKLAAETISERLYFGRDIPGGGQVTEAQWTAFLAEVITPRFPAGLTVLRAEGQWRGADGVIVHEPSVVVELLHPDAPASDQAVRE